MALDLLYAPIVVGFSPTARLGPAGCLILLDHASSASSSPSPMQFDFDESSHDRDILRPLVSQWHSIFVKLHHQLDQLQSDNCQENSDEASDDLHVQSIATLQKASGEYQQQLELFLQQLHLHSPINDQSTEPHRPTIEFDALMDLLTQANLLWKLVDIRFLTCLSSLPSQTPFMLLSQFAPRLATHFSLSSFIADMVLWFQTLVVLPSPVDVPALNSSALVLDSESGMEGWTAVLRWAMVGRIADVITYLCSQRNAVIAAIVIAHQPRSLNEDDDELLSLADVVIRRLMDVLRLCPWLPLNRMEPDTMQMPHWQATLRQLFQEEPFLAACAPLVCLMELLAAESVQQWQQQCDAAGHWSHLVVAQLLYGSDTIASFDHLAALSQRCHQYWTQSMIGDISAFEQCVLSTLDGDLSSTLRVFSSVVAVPCLTAHLVDLLACSVPTINVHELAQSQNDKGITQAPCAIGEYVLFQVRLSTISGDGVDLREFHLLHYAHSLAYQSETWQLSVDYYQRCGHRGRAGLSAMLQHRALALTNEDSSSQLAPKLMQLCEQFGLDAERDLVCRLMIQNSLQPLQSVCLRLKSFASISNDSGIVLPIVSQIAELNNVWYWCSMQTQPLVSLLDSVSEKLLHLYHQRIIDTSVLEQGLDHARQIKSLSSTVRFFVAFVDLQIMLLNNQTIIDLHTMVDLLASDTVPLPFCMPMICLIARLNARSSISNRHSDKSAAKALTLPIVSLSMADTQALLHALEQTRMRNRCTTQPSLTFSYCSENEVHSACLNLMQHVVVAALQS